MNKIKLLQSLVVVMSLSLVFGVQARMYKWVDEDGVTQYTQTPPPGEIEAKTIEVEKGPAPASAASKDKSVLQNTVKKEEKEQAAAEDTISDAEYEAQVQKACESARKSLLSYQRNRVNLVDKDGNVRVAGEEERQAGLKAAEQAIKKYCK